MFFFKLTLLYELENNMSYVNNMIYVKSYELRHELCKLYEHFYKSLKIK